MPNEHPDYVNYKIMITNLLEISGMLWIDWTNLDELYVLQVLQMQMKTVKDLWTEHYLSALRRCVFATTTLPAI